MQTVIEPGCVPDTSQKIQRTESKTIDGQIGTGAKAGIDPLMFRV